MATEDDAARRPMFAMICINNVNRSPAAHERLKSAGLRVCSFGAGRHVSVPSRSPTAPREFRFETPYRAMHEQLRREDEELFSRNGVLAMLERDIATKDGPERWQSLSSKQLRQIDVVVCLDYQMYLVVLNDLSMRIHLSLKRKHLHLICLDVEDTPEDARSGSQCALELCKLLDAAAAADGAGADLSDACVKEIIVDFEHRHNLQLFYVGVQI
ncbi:hypothetical protein PybrP1_002447 [[Pythium] brassicae (nom. inval.)]|nr:hypothetical protein PybrP1_002447 [[Pythium] brassicae (nom. inval.)]